jgi:hypothetical protein
MWIFLDMPRKQWKRTRYQCTGFSHTLYLTGAYSIRKLESALKL